MNDGRNITRAGGQKDVSLEGTTLKKENKLSRGEICVANFKAPLRMVRVWTGI